VARIRVTLRSWLCRWRSRSHVKVTVNNIFLFFTYLLIFYQYTFLCICWLWCDSLYVVGPSSIIVIPHSQLVGLHVWNNIHPV